MTVEKPLWIQALTYPARLDRALLASVFGEGLLTGFAVSQRGVGANMSVDVAAGKAIITGDDQADQGNYYVRSTATENVVVSAAPGANSRIDIVVLKINDPNAGGPVGDNMQIQVIAGTAAASPVAPATPASALLLATVGPILTSTTSITTAMITNVATTATLAFDVVDDDQMTRVGTDLGVAGAIMRRDSNGRVRAVSPTTAGEVAVFPITAAQIDTEAVTNAKIGPEAVSNGKIAAAAVSNSKIGDGQVSTAKLADLSVTTGKIVDGAVTTAKIADDAVTLAKLDGHATGTVDSGRIGYARIGSGTGAIVIVWTTTGSPGGTLPAGFRPAATVFAGGLQVSTGGASAITIGTDGVITTTGASAAYFTVVFAAA